MHSSKLIKIFSIFNEEELSHLQQFLRSPYFFNKLPSNEILVLFDHIQYCLFHGEEEKLSKEFTFQVVFQSDKFVKGKLEKMMSTLLKATEKFMVYHFSGLQENETKQKLILAKLFRQRKLDHQFELIIKQLNKLQSRVERKNNAFYYTQFLIEKEISDFESFYNTRDKDLNLLNTMRNLDTYYFSTRLEHACWLFSQAKHHASSDWKKKDYILEKLTPIMGDTPFNEIPLIKVYLLVYQFLEEKENVFSTLEQLLEQYEDQLPWRQMKDLQALCRNYFIMKYNEGEEKYLTEAFRLYKLHLEKGYLYHEDDLLIPSTFGNLVTMGIKLEQFDWVFNFIESCKDRITGTDAPEDIYNFNVAQYYFAIKDYDSSLDSLSFNYEDLYYKMAAKRLELKVYYEMESELLEPRMDAFKILTFRLSKKMLSATHQKANNNFIDLLKQIINPKTKGNIGRVEKLIEKINNQKKTLSEKEWLLDILESMK